MWTQKFADTEYRSFIVCVCRHGHFQIQNTESLLCVCTFWRPQPSSSPPKDYPDLLKTTASSRPPEYHPDLPKTTAFIQTIGLTIWGRSKFKSSCRRRSHADNAHLNVQVLVVGVGHEEPEVLFPAWLGGGGTDNTLLRRLSHCQEGEGGWLLHCLLTALSHNIQHPWMHTQRVQRSKTNQTVKLSSPTLRVTKRVLPEVYWPS